MGIPEKGVSRYRKGNILESMKENRGQPNSMLVGYILADGSEVLANRSISQVWES